MGVAELTKVRIKPTMSRRLGFSTYVVISQMLLVALSIAWLVHMVIIKISGSIYFIENNQFILWGETIASIIIAIFAIFVLAGQIRRLGERRSTDRNAGDRRR